MIKKFKHKAPKCLVEKGSKGRKEKKRAIEFFEEKSNVDISFPFSAYKEDEVKKLLSKTFNMKCAYCESKWGITSYLTIEHYRPKSRIEDENTGEKIRPGYYWLASEWSNLFPSCTNCNTRQNQNIWGASGKKLSGKGELFPLENKKNRASAPNKIKYESPLLLNPYLDTPSKYLDFTKEGLVYPKRTKNGSFNKRGKISIDIYGLMREELVKERQKLLRSIDFRLLNIEEKKRHCLNFPKNKLHKKSLERELQELNEFFHDDMPYLGMIRQLFPKLSKKKKV